MKKRLYLVLILLLVFPCTIKANIICNDGTVSPKCADCHRGCCSHHGGCSSSYSNSSSNSGGSTTTSTTRSVQRAYTQPKSSDTSIRSIKVNSRLIRSVNDINTITTYDKSVSIIVNLNDTKATYQVNGNTDLSIGLNTFNIVVTAEDGTIKEYVLNINRKVRKSNVTLKLYINNSKINFNSKNTYSTSKKFKNNKIKLKYETSDKTSNVAVYNNNEIAGKTIKLKKGKNKIKLVITDSNGDINTYKVNITRKK